MKKSENWYFKPELIWTISTFLLLLLLNFQTNGTGDSGDSIKHFLYSKYSFQHPEFFFHHWAKPVFVLLSAPFAWFGFKGIIVFNSLCASLIGFYSYKTAVELKFDRPWLVFLFLFFAPLFFALIFSGLTEYLFALFLIIGVYLFSRTHFVSSLFLISFLPLVRSEGLVILIVFGGYLLWLRKFKLLPLLFAGQLLYSIVGAFFYKDLLWLIHEIPYANLKERYGSGSLFDFVHRLNYVIEKPIYLLLAIGSLVVGLRFLQNRHSKIEGLLFFLVLGSFLAVFVSHSIFWWKGIFNSMGLPRVLLAIHPAIALLALVGINWILQWVKNEKVKIVTLGGICLLVILFPFTYRSKGVVFNSKLFHTLENDMIESEIKPFLIAKYPDYQKRVLFYTHPAISLVLNQDYFNEKIHQEIHRLPTEKISKNALVIWDNKMAVIESGVSLIYLKNRNDLVEIASFSQTKNNEYNEFVVFATKP